MFILTPQPFWHQLTDYYVKLKKLLNANILYRMIFHYSSEFLYQTS